MSEHALKIDPQPFADLASGAKTCEIRNDDRDFQVGDTVQLHEREDADFTGRTLRRTISHIQRGYGLPDGLCVLSYAAPAAPQQGDESAQPQCRDERVIRYSFEGMGCTILHGDGTPVRRNGFPKGKFVREEDLAALNPAEAEGSAAQKSFWAGFEAAHLSKSTNIREAWNHYKATDEFARLNPSAHVVTYTTQPGESVMGIALRQLKDEARWVEICDLNAAEFPDMGPHDYYPVGTVLKMPSHSAQGEKP